MDVHLASLLGHMKTIKYLYMQLFQARRNVTSILLVLAWPTNRKSTQNKEFKNAESNIKHARNILHIGTGIIVSSRHREGFNF